MREQLVLVSMDIFPGRENEVMDAYQTDDMGEIADRILGTMDGDMTMPLPEKITFVEENALKVGLQIVAGSRSREN